MKLIMITAISAAVIFTALTTHSLLAANENIQQKEELERLQSSIEQGLRNIVPSTAIMAFYSKECPTGWLPANGKNKTPDLRGEFIRGLDRGRGVDKFYELDEKLNATAKERPLGSWQAPTLITAGGVAQHLRHVTVGSSDGKASPMDFYSGLQADSIRNNWYSTALTGGAFGTQLIEQADTLTNGTRKRANFADIEGIPLNAETKTAGVTEYPPDFFHFGGTRPRNVALLYCMKE